MHRRAFTLIELLVVVAIIAVLIAILLPSLSRAKANAVRVQCESNLSQWGKVITMYQTENQDWFGILMRVSANEKYFWNTVALGTPTLYDHEWSADLKTGTAVSQQFRTCPGDPMYGLFKAAGANGGAILKPPSGKRPPVDYAMPRYNNSPGSANSATLWRVTQFAHPGTTCLMLDGPPNDQSTSNHNMSQDYAFANMNDLDTSYQPDFTMPNCLQQRHMGNGNVLFLDGHAEQQNYQDYCNNIPSASDPFDKNTASDSTKHWLDMQD